MATFGRVGEKFVMPDYRYFLAFRPDARQRAWLDSLADAAGQSEKRIKADNLHLTLCVIAELSHRDRFIASRVDSALNGHRLASSPFWLGRLRGGRHGAAIYAMGRQREIQDFYRQLVACLAERDILPFHRKSGLHPHVTLGYDRCPFDPLAMPREWIPDELLLIESEIGKGVHNVLARWPLLPPRQGAFAFGDPPELDPLRLAAGARRP
jgi:2'-5' RNA ligase